MTCLVAPIRRELPSVDRLSVEDTITLPDHLAWPYKAEDGWIPLLPWE